MTYDLSQPLDRRRMAARAKALLDHGAIVELTEKVTRSLNQNAYLHLIIGVVAMEAGETLEYAKREYFKRHVNGDLFICSKQDRLLGADSQRLRSSAELTKEEMSLAIDRFKKWAAEQGIYLPEPGDDALLAQIRCEMDKCRRWL